MQRRDFLMKSAGSGLALGLLPTFARALTTPCPPPTLAVAGGQPVTTACPTGASGSNYSTNFPLTENPISEGGNWQNNGLDWTNVQTTPGLAFGTQDVVNTYNDSYAHLGGFPANVQVTAVMHSSVPSGSIQESEILLRFSDSAHAARGYEINLNSAGAAQIVRWNGAIGDFTPLSTTGPGGLGRDVVTGDVFMATSVGSTLSLYVNGALLAQAVDSTFATGNPGIGFFSRLGASNNSRFGFTSFSAQPA